VYEFIDFTVDYENWTDHPGSQKDKKGRQTYLLRQLHELQSQVTVRKAVGTGEREIRADISGCDETPKNKLYCFVSNATRKTWTNKTCLLSMVSWICRIQPGIVLIQLFIDSKGLTGIDDFPMLRIKDVPHMVKVLDQEARFGAI
jgi:hypothetical protein